MQITFFVKLEFKVKNLGVKYYKDHGSILEILKQIIANFQIENEVNRFKFF